MNYQYALLEIIRRPKRTIAGFLSIALSVALFLSLQAYSSGYKEAARAPLYEIGVDIVAQREGQTPEEFSGIVFPHSSGSISRAQIDEMKKLDGVAEISEGVFFWYFEDQRFMAGLGFDSSQNFGPGRLKAGLKEGRFIEQGESGVLLVDLSFAEQNDVQIGESVTLSGKSFSVIGIVDSSRAGQIANANVFVSLEDARMLAHSSNNVQKVDPFGPEDSNIIFVKSLPSKAAGLSEQMKDILGQNAIITTPRSFDDVLGATFALVDRFGLLVGAVAVIVAMFSLFRSAVSGISERKQDIALMRATGWSRGDVKRQIITENMIISLSGAIAGIVLSFGISYILRFTKVTVPVPWELSPTPHFLPGGAKEIALVVPLDAQITGFISLLAVVISTVIGGLVCLWAARAATSIKPMEVWRND